MKSKFFLILLLIWMVQASGTLAAPAAPFVIRIPAERILVEPKITFWDLGTVSGVLPENQAVLQRIEMGLVPLPGQVRTFSREYLSFILRQHHFSQEWELKMDKQLTVRSDATCIVKSQLEAAVFQLFDKRPPQFTKRWVELENTPAAVWLAKGDWRIKASVNGAEPAIGPILFKVMLDDGKTSRELNIAGRLRASAFLYRAKRDLGYKVALATSDFERIEMELTSSREFTGDFSAPLRSLKPIRQGEILRADQCQLVPLVQKNHEVKVIVKGSDLEVNLTGIAATDGWSGDEILIVNPTSQKKFHGRVVDLNTVEVNVK
jgi:flagella basal body P-ring formation protein FlgA